MLAENRDQRGARLDRTYDGIDARAQREWLREGRIPTVAVTETPRSWSRDVAEPEIGHAEPREQIERVERLGPWQVERSRCARHRSVLPPLHIDRDLPLPAPSGVQDRRVPIRP